MAERGTSKWIPPDFDPNKHGSVNAYHGTHALRERARKIHQGIIIVRFEMPFPTFCLQCESHLDTGVRFNAEKSKIGSYYSSPIYLFGFKCPHCDARLEIKTDPQNADFVLVTGLRRDERYVLPEGESSKDGVVVLDTDHAVPERTALDQLEHQVHDQKKADAEKPFLVKLYRHQDERWGDPYTANSVLRKKLRNEKAAISVSNTQTQSLRNKLSLPATLPIVSESGEDTNIASSITFGPTNTIEYQKTQRAEESVFKKKRKHKDVDHGDVKSGKEYLKKLALKTVDPFSINASMLTPKHVKLPTRKPEVSGIKKESSSSCVDASNDSGSSSRVSIDQDDNTISITSTTNGERNGLAMLSGYGSDSD